MAVLSSHSASSAFAVSSKLDAQDVAPVVVALVEGKRDGGIGQDVLARGGGHAGKTVDCGPSDAYVAVAAFGAPFLSVVAIVGYRCFSG